MSQMTKIAFIRARAGQTEELGRRLRALAAPSRREAGCLAFDVRPDRANPDLWLVHESWESPAAMARAHQREAAREIAALIDTSTRFDVGMST